MRYKISSVLSILAISLAAFWIALHVMQPGPVLAQYNPPRGATGPTGPAGPAGIAVGFAQSCSAFSGTSGTISCTFTNPNAAGDTIVISVGTSPESGTCFASPADSHNSYTQIYQSGNETELQIFYATNIAGGSNTVSLTTSCFWGSSIIAEEFTTTPAATVTLGAAGQGVNSVSGGSFSNANPTMAVMAEIVDDTTSGRTASIASGTVDKVVNEGSFGGDTIAAAYQSVPGVSSYANLWTNTPTYIASWTPVVFINSLGATNSLSASVTLTALQVTGMFAAPVQVIPAQGAGTLIVVDHMTLNAVFGSAAFTGGGNIALYYGNASPPVSQLSSSSVASFLTTFSANQISNGGAINGGSSAIVLSSIAVDAPVYISNVTAPFVGGTGASLIVTVSYHVLTGVF